MLNVREIFPDLEKFKRVRRGVRSNVSWNKAPSLDQIINKIAPTILDRNIKPAVKGGQKYDMHRYLVKNKNKYGYLCFTSLGVSFDNCKSYNDFQSRFSNLEGSIKWFSSYKQMIEHINDHCSSDLYKKHVQGLKS